MIVVNCKLSVDEFVRQIRAIEEEYGGKEKGQEVALVVEENSLRYAGGHHFSWIIRLSILYFGHLFPVFQFSLENSI